jgi:hypothetical protein
MTHPMTTPESGREPSEMVRRVASAICLTLGDHPEAEAMDSCDPVNDGRPNWETWTDEARAAIAAVRAYDAEVAAEKAKATNIAYLQANIAQMDKFLERPKADDPIGHHQWRSRRESFVRELDAALRAGQAEGEG